MVDIIVCKKLFLAGDVLGKLRPGNGNDLGLSSSMLLRLAVDFAAVILLTILTFI